ncbi:MAG: hypothetical protein IJD33_01950 [Clostridia bacterium]|nr:hypothetical protein [Clostridia bacterium]
MLAVGVSVAEDRALTITYKKPELRPEVLEVAEEEKKDYKSLIYLILTVSLLVVSLLLSVFHFERVFFRVMQSIEDFGRSVGFYFTDLLEMDRTVRVTVTEIPKNAKEVLPFEANVFKAQLSEYGKLLISWSNIKKYLAKTGEILAIVASVALPVMLILWIVWTLIKSMYKEPDQAAGEESMPLRSYKVCERFSWDKLKWFVKDYAAYLSERKAWLWTFGILWAYNLNAITIALEVLAYWFYFSRAFDFKNLFTLIAKVAMDLTVAIDFLPAFVWVIVTYLIFDHVRREIGYTVLSANEASNEKFLEDNPGNIFLTGPPRIGKTRIATSMGLTQEVLFRKKAQEKAFERHMEFPHFKWAVLENTLKAMRDRLPFYSLATLRVFFDRLAYNFKARALYNPENYWFELDKLTTMGYPEDCEDFLFGYDYRRYGNEYNNGLKIVDIFETLLLYSEEYYIYTCPTSLIVGNYPVRTDIVFSDLGNYPLMDADFFHSDPRELKERSKMSKLLIYDMMRLQRKRDPNEPYQHNLEIGVIQITEAGKERGNQNTNATQKADASAANAKNDGLEMDAKIHSHGATIDFYTYFRIILDEQRAASLMADFRELASECKIKGKSPDRLAMPFFEFEEALYLVVGAFFKSKVYYFLRNVKGKDTLLLYLAHKLYKLIYDHRMRVWNTFGMIKVNLSLRSTVDGEGHEEKGKGAWNLSFKKDNADRYDTGALGSYYHEKGLQSDNGGIYQIPVWSRLRPPMQEYRRLGGYLTDRMDETFGLGLIHVKHEDKPKKAEKGKKAA